MARILIVDDDEVIVGLCSEMLLELGYDARGFTDPGEALDHFKQHPDSCELLIVDYSMPGMNGAEFCEAIQQIRPGLPVILITGYDPDLPNAALYKAGIKQVLHKPFRYAELGDAVATAFNASRAGD
jgi:CheY-like chemotaxis protein